MRSRSDRTGCSSSSVKPSAQTGCAEFNEPVGDQWLRHVTRIVSQQSTESLTAFHLSGDLADLFAGVDDLVFEALVISLLAVMRKIKREQHVAASSHRRRSFSPSIPT